MGAPETTLIQWLHVSRKLLKLYTEAAESIAAGLLSEVVQYALVLSKLLCPPSASKTSKTSTFSAKRLQVATNRLSMSSFRAAVVLSVGQCVAVMLSAGNRPETNSLLAITQLIVVLVDDSVTDTRIAATKLAARQFVPFLQFQGEAQAMQDIGRILLGKTLLLQADMGGEEVDKSRASESHNILGSALVELYNVLEKALPPETVAQVKKRLGTDASEFYVEPINDVDLPTLEDSTAVVPGLSSTSQQQVQSLKFVDDFPSKERSSKDNVVLLPSNATRPSLEEKNSKPKISMLDEVIAKDDIDTDDDENDNPITLPPADKQTQVEFAPTVNLAEEWKLKGNAMLSQGMVEEALECYGQSIHFDDKQHAAYLNRAVAYSKKNKYDKAIEDCSQVLRDIDCPRETRMKALFRRGQAKRAMGREGDAYMDYQAALELEPHNQRLLKAIAAMGQS